MIVWGGRNAGNYFNTGGKYNPSTDNWAATSTTNAPGARFGHPAVWTGSDMVVWGGTNMQKQFNTGGKYNPGADNWIATPINAPERRAYHTAVWSGSEMIVWGGLNDFGPFYLNTGGRYCAQPDATPPTPTPTPTPTPNSYSNIDAYAESKRYTCRKTSSYTASAPVALVQVIDAFAERNTRQKRCEDAPHSKGTSCDMFKGSRFCFAKLWECA